MLWGIQHIILWGKFRSLHRRYHAQREQSTHRENKVSLQRMEETFWHETALLLEERRRLHFPKTIMHPNLPNLPLSTNYPKSLLPAGRSQNGEYFFQQEPPSAAYLALFSLLGGIAMGTGLSWLLLPLMLY